MNTLTVGLDKTLILPYATGHYLFIDDGSLIDQLTVPKRRAVTVFDVSEHSFNPLKDMSYTKARDFINVLNAVFPEGENTLTRKNSNFILLNALLAGPRKLETLIAPSKDPYQTDAYQKVQELLLSPVLESVLTKPTNMSFKGTIHARLDRAVLGDFDCFVLANLLISQYPGTVIIPDFGFYACPFHVALIRQGRLIAGINSFEEAPKLKQHLLLIDEKVASHCTPDDAKILALYQGLYPDPTREDNDYNRFIAKSIGRVES